MKQRQSHDRSSARNAIFACLISVCVFAQQVFGFGSPAYGQDQTISVGVFEFQDESGASLPAGFTQKIARLLAQKLNVDHKDLLARHFNAAADASQSKAKTIEQLCALGKQQGVKFIVRGGLLDASNENSSGETTAAIQLYADVVSVESLSVKSFRAEGSGAAKDQALSNAIGQLAAMVHRAMISPGESFAEDKPPQAPAGASEQIDPKDVAAGESDEELQQLIAQTELLASDGSTVGAERLAALSKALAALKAALKSKATLLEEGKDTAAVDLEIAAEKEKLQAYVSALAEDETSPGPVEIEEQQPTAEKKNVLARVGEYANEALNIIQKIQEIRAALRGGSRNDTSAALEPTGEIAGVVTEMGEPVAGVAVTEPETGVSAVTDNNGAYSLRGVAAGRPTKLVVMKGGKQIAAGRIHLVRGRSSTADFELKPLVASKFQPAFRIIPSTVMVPRAKSRDGNVGVLKGTVEDEQGRPSARALVILKGFAIARTDSKGKYVFGNVPSGTHQLIINRIGLKPKTVMVRVAAQKSNRNLSPRDSNGNDKQTDREPPQRNKIIGANEMSPGQPRGGNSKGNIISRPQPPVEKDAIREGQLRGRIVDARTGRPIPGAFVSVARQRSVTSDREGFYAFLNLAAGAHQVIARKGEFIDSIATLVIRPGVTTTANFRLNPKPPARFR